MVDLVAGIDPNSSQFGPIDGENIWVIEPGDEDYKQGQVWLGYTELDPALGEPTYYMMTAELYFLGRAAMQGETVTQAEADDFTDKLADHHGIERLARSGAA